MKPTPLLDFWQKPAEAGDPVAMLATTFALEPDFFEHNCLAHFLEVSSVNEDTGSIDDIVAGVELQELLQKVQVTVLADRSAPVRRGSLFWDLLACHVPTGLLHAKVVLLIWENATRVILGSANLTSAGYRRQIEIGLAADLGAACLFPSDVLEEIANELETYLLLVPGFNVGVPVIERANATLSLFRKRITQQVESRNNALKVAFAPTNEFIGALDAYESVWNGSRPTQATHLSPFWDGNSSVVLERTRALLTGQPASQRSHQVAVVANPNGEIGFSKFLRKSVNDVRLLVREDQEARTLHAKCLLLESKKWVAAMVGSSNHTKAGLGLGSPSEKRHREMNVWFGAARDSKEGKALLDLIRLGKAAPIDAPTVESKDEDEVDAPALPTCFELCRLRPSAIEGSWDFFLGINASQRMPAAWQIKLADGAPLLTHQQWKEEQEPLCAQRTVALSTLPMYVTVTWEGKSAPWAVLAENRHELPPGAALSVLNARQLLSALAHGRSLTQVLRDELQTREARTSETMLADLNPLTRLEVKDSLLRKGRELSESLKGMQSRLQRPVLTSETLRARLAGPLGPEFVCQKVFEAMDAGHLTRAEAMFTLAEITLTIGRIDWRNVMQKFDFDEGLEVVVACVARLDVLRNKLGEDPAEIAAYAQRAIGEARRCLVV